jgi:hypothetical protein
MAATEDGASCIGHWRSPKLVEDQRPRAAGGGVMLTLVAWMELVSPKVWEGSSCLSMLVGSFRIVFAHWWLATKSTQGSLDSNGCPQSVSCPYH